MTELFKKYKIKQVEVEALELTKKNVQKVYNEINSSSLFKCEFLFEEKDDIIGLKIENSENYSYAEFCNFILKFGPEGEYISITKEEFNEKYEEHI